MHDCWVRKLRKFAECLVFIENKVLGALQCNIKFSAYLLYDSDLEYVTDEDEEAVNGV